MVDVFLEDKSGEGTEQCDKDEGWRNEALRERKSSVGEGKEALMLLLQNFASPTPGFSTLIFLLSHFELNTILKTRLLKCEIKTRIPFRGLFFI